MAGGTGAVLGDHTVGRALHDRHMVAQLVKEMKTADYKRAFQEKAGKRGTAESGYSVETIKTVLTPLSATFDYAKEELGFAGANPVRDLGSKHRPGYKERKAERRMLRDHEDLHNLMEAAQSPWREIIATAVALGTRMGETLGLKWSDVDLTNGTVSIRRQANAKRQLVPCKTARSERVIAAPDWYVATLREWRMRSPLKGADDLVFATRTGRPHGHGNVLARGLYPALEAAGLPKVSFHSLRHAHASLWMRNGGDVASLSARLGHENAQVTLSIYTHEFAESDARRREQANAMFSGTTMASGMAAREGSSEQQEPHEQGGEVSDLSEARDTRQQAAGAND